MTASTKRQFYRTAHIIAGVLIALAIYSPSFSGNATFLAVVQFIAFPFFAASGLIMWKGPAMRRVFRK